MKLQEAKKLLRDIKKATIHANNEGDSFRVGYLKYCRKEIKNKIYQFFRDNKMIPEEL